MWWLRLRTNAIGIVDLWLWLLLLLDWNKLLLQLRRLLLLSLSSLFFIFIIIIIISPSLPSTSYTSTSSTSLLLSFTRHSKVKPAKRAAHINIKPAGNALIMEMMQLIARQYSYLLTVHIIHPADRAFAITADFPRSILKLLEQPKSLCALPLVLASLVCHVRKIPKDCHRNHYTQESKETIKIH